MNAELVEISARLKKAWNALPEADKAKFRPYINKADQQLQEHLITFKGETSEDIPHTLVLVKSLLDENNEGLAAKTQAIYELKLPVHVDAGGNIWGVAKYEILDPHWVEAVTEFFKQYINGKYQPFPSKDIQPIIVPNNIKIAIAGDWGTGNWGSPTNPAGSTKIINAIKNLNPDYTIHLGDVYYAGTQSEEKDKFTSLWPVGTKGAFTLNSNHEMCSGGEAYFKDTLGGSFPLQQKQSYFALENDYWVIVGLDTAYFDTSFLYMHGTLGDNPQLAFLTAMASKGKKMIIFTHHNGLKDNKNGTQSQNNPLWKQVTDAIKNNKQPAYWYWGHVHTGVVYAPQNKNPFFCRCLGHGGIPWGHASELATAQGNNAVLWFEDTNAADPDLKERVVNGFVTIELEEDVLTETFYTENGKISWTRTS